MSFFKAKAAGLRVTRLTAVLVFLGLVSGCHFEARVSTGDDAKKKEPKTQTAKADDKKKANDKKDKKVEAKSNEKADDKKKANDKKDKSTQASKDPVAKEDPTAAAASKESVPLPGNLVFEAGKSTLKEGSASEDVLRSLKTYLEQQPRVTLLRIEGHSDNAAAPEENLRISGERALTVKTWLIGKGIAASRLVAVGFGESKPIADNASEEGRAQNRRVEFKVAKINNKPYLGNDPLGGGTEFK